MTKEQKRNIISQLNGRTQIQAFEAAKTIWNDPDAGLAKPLIWLLRKGRRPFNRAAAAHAMQIVVTQETIRALEQTLANSLENTRVRGYAAEALAHAHRPKSHDLLLRGLKDSSKNVRFWCAFALGEMAERRAVAQLQYIAESDKRMVQGFHPVATEAIDALKNIQEEKPFHWCKYGCVFCIRKDR